MDVGLAPSKQSPLSSGAPAPAPPSLDSCLAPSRRAEADPTLLTADEEIHLAERIEAGDQRAREELIARNLRLVFHIARSYEGYAHGALAFEDLVQEGRLGLIKAVDRYDPRRGCRFSTYASHWISQAISRAVDDQYRTIRIPAYAGQLARRASRRFDELTRELGREPNDDELAHDLGVPVDRILEIASVARPALSLDSPIQEGDEAAVVGDFVEDTRARPTFDAAHEALLREQISNALSLLSPRERQIICRRFGLEDGREQTLSEVGGQMCMTRERVRQIEKRALKKLRMALGSVLDD